MRRIIAITAAGFTAIFGAMPPAAAISPQRAAIDSGEFETARRLGRTEATAEGYAIACQAGLIIGSYFDTGAARVATLHDAINDCARAVEAGAGVDAHVNYAIGVAFEAKRLRSRTLAIQSRRLMEAAIARFPDSGYAHGAIAGWQASASAEGALARAAVGASWDRADAAFAAALRLDPDNFALRYEYLRRLARGDETARAEAAALARQLTLHGRPATAFERLLAERVAIIERSLADGRESAAKTALASTEPFAGVDKDPVSDPRSKRFRPPFGDSFPEMAR